MSVYRSATMHALLPGHFVRHAGGLLMDAPYRIALIIMFVAAMSVGIYSRWQARTAEKFDRRQEGLLLAIALRRAGLWRALKLVIWVRAAEKFSVSFMDFLAGESVASKRRVALTTCCRGPAGTEGFLRRLAIEALPLLLLRNTDNELSVPPVKLGRARKAASACKRARLPSLKKSLGVAARSDRVPFLI